MRDDPAAGPEDEGGPGDAFGPIDASGPMGESGPGDAFGGEARRGRRGRVRSRRRAVLEMLGMLVAAVGLSLILKAFVIQVYSIPSQSMENTLMVGDRVLVNKLAFHIHGIRRGDVIVFSGDGSWGDLNGQQTDYIKRVIGLPGDRVACCTDGDITVNGVPLDESSFIIPATQNAGAAAPSSQDTFSITVPPGRLWVMGDNRADSDDSMLHYTEGHDSLTASTIPRAAVIGQALFVIWPLPHLHGLPVPGAFSHVAASAVADLRAVIGWAL